MLAEGADLDRLEHEVESLLASPLDALCARLQVSPEGLLFRVENIREAVRQARSVEGGRGGVSIG